MSLLLGTVAKGSNGNEKTDVPATKRGDIEY